MACLYNINFPGGNINIYTKSKATLNILPALNKHLLSE
jgi:hypothetical protein